MTHKVWREVETALRESGLPWSIKNGKRHHHVFVNDRRVGVMSFGSNVGRDAKNLIARIQRLAQKAAK